MELKGDHPSGLTGARSNRRRLRRAGHRLGLRRTGAGWRTRLHDLGVAGYAVEVEGLPLRDGEQEVDDYERGMNRLYLVRTGRYYRMIARDEAGCGGNG